MTGWWIIVIASGAKQSSRVLPENAGLWVDLPARIDWIASSRFADPRDDDGEPVAQASLTTALDMTNSTHKLVQMANQIAAFFRPYPADQAAAGVREHVEAFWTPAMRATLRARIAADPAGLDPLVLAAFAADGPSEGPAHREAAGPDEAGQLGASDAG